MRRVPSARGRLSAMVAGIALLAAVSGCTQFGTYRRAPIVGQGGAVTVKEVHCAAGWMPAQRLADRSSEPRCEPDKANDGSSEKSSDVGAASIQRRHYLYRGKGDAEATRRGDYDLAFVEFDDQGWFPQRPHNGGAVHAAAPDRTGKAGSRERPRAHLRVRPRVEAQRERVRQQRHLLLALARAHGHSRERNLARRGPTSAPGRRRLRRLARSRQSTPARCPTSRSGRARTTAQRVGRGGVTGAAS